MRPRSWWNLVYAAAVLLAPVSHQHAPAGPCLDRPSVGVGEDAGPSLAAGSACASESGHPHACASCVLRLGGMLAATERPSAAAEASGRLVEASGPVAAATPPLRSRGRSPPAA